MPLVARQFALSLVAIVCALAGPLSAGDRYEAWLADGTKLSGNFIPAWPLPDASFRFENQDLLDPKNPLRLMRDRSVSVAPRAPYVVLANGDVLSGGPIALEPELGRVVRVPRVRVQLEPPLMPVVGTALAVRADRIARIVGTQEAARSDPPPGAVMLTDGRRLIARSIRWRESGLALLTAEGVVEVAYGELADVVFPDIDRQAAVLDDCLRANTTSASFDAAAIVRFQMAGGAVLTASRVRREIEQSRRRRLTTNVYYYVQPAWCEQPLAVPEPVIAWCGYRRADEAPLPLLAATTLANERLVGKVQPWRANRAADGGLLSAGGRDSDLGIAAHAHSALAFDLPQGAVSLDLAAALDKEVGRGGCVQCRVLVDDRGGKQLWDSGIFTGADGVVRPEPIDLAGLRRVVLVADYAHEGRPAGADPLDIRDQVVWLAPLVKLDLDSGDRRRRAAGALTGLDDWELLGKDWERALLESRWNTFSHAWDQIVVLPREAQLQLRRKVPVTMANDVLELFTACPRELDEHEFSLTVNGTELEPTNNINRDDQRQWIMRYGRLSGRDENEDPRYSDKLAYWWDLSRWHGQEVALELTLRGQRERNEIAWRRFGLRPAIANLPAGDRPLKPAVQLTSVETLERTARNNPLPNAIPSSRYGEPIRFLGRQFSGGYGLGKDSRISFALKPEFHKFVAVAGCCVQYAGPMQVLIDDQVVWERTLVSSLMPAEQIEIAIPAGAKKLTLVSGNDGTYLGFAAWAEAGFLGK